MNALSEKITGGLVAGAIFFAWFFMGVVETSGEWEDNHAIFVKKIPTLKIAFFNPYESYPYGPESEYRKRRDIHGDWLPGTYELQEFLEYCKYRYGVIAVDPIKARSICKMRLKE